MPADVKGHFGAELRRFVLGQHHQGQVATPRLLAQLLAIGIEISKRQLTRLLIADHEPFIEEARDVLRAGLSNASWIGVDGPVGTGEAVGRATKGATRSARRSATTASPGSGRPLRRAA